MITTTNLSVEPGKAHEAFPSFEKLAHYAMSYGDVERRTAMGTYGALSCFSHPNFVASRELRRNESDDDPYLVYSHDATYVEKLVRMAIVGIANALNRWIGYNDHDHDRLHAKMSEVLEQWENLSASLSPKHDP
jgi:hypothetical protein